MWVRYNPTTRIYEYSTNNGASFAQLPLDASSFTHGSIADARLSANVPLKNASNIFSSTNFFTAGNPIQVESSQPTIDFRETDQGLNLKRWRILMDAQLFFFQTLDDAYSTILANPLILNRSGDITVGRDVYVNRNISLAGGQIIFPATQIPSTNANILDDYEEGTYTPVDVSGAGLSLGGGGTYFKIGRTCRVYGQVIYPATANVAAATVGGLPFVSPSNNALSIGYSSHDVRGWGPAAVSYFHFLSPANVLQTNANMSGANVVFSVSYDVGT